VAQLFDEGLAGGDAEHPVLVQRRVAFDGEDVVAVVLFHAFFERALGGVAGGGHQHVLVVQRDHRQDHVLHQRMRAERMNDSEQQVHSRPLSQITGVLGRVSIALRDLRHEGGAKPERGGGERAIFHETAPGDPLATHDVIEGFDS
jgi:hypothetical protein